MRRWILLLSVLLTVTVAPVLAQDGGHWLDAFEGEPCPKSDFTCITLTMPLDHTNPESGETIDVTFAVLPASGERKGMFVVSVGGPGYSGLSVADSYTEPLDPLILELFDIVYFDQRGMGLSGALDCPNANAAWYQADGRADTPEQEAALVVTMRTFAQDCVAEMGGETGLPYFGTTQAVEDLELFRQAVGDEQFWLYGESYGTQFAQTYAAAHPANVAGLILDGVVDLTLEGDAYYVGQTGGFNDALSASLAACNADTACAADIGGEAGAAYDSVQAVLQGAPVTVAFPLASGENEDREFTESDLIAVAASAMYEQTDRMIFLRALASAAHGDYLPLLRLTYVYYGLDPQTLDVIPDASFSNGMYYGVECNDYNFFSGTPDERAEAFLRGGDAVDEMFPRMKGGFYTDMPCAFWPVEGLAERPAPFTGEGIPTFVLNSDIDPATPVSNGYSVFSRLADGYMITQRGGPHVIWGRGNACPDVAIMLFLTEDTLPAERISICDGDAIAGYLPLTDGDDLTDAASLFEAIDDNIYYLAEYYYWDLYTPVTTGCPHGGLITFDPTDDGDTMTLEACEFIDGVVLDGTGTSIYGESFVLDVAISGSVEGNVVYTRDDYGGMFSLTGVYQGEDAAQVPAA